MILHRNFSHSNGRRQVRGSRGQGKDERLEVSEQEVGVVGLYVPLWCMRWMRWRRQFRTTSLAQEEASIPTLHNPDFLLKVCQPSDWKFYVRIVGNTSYENAITFSVYFLTQGEKSLLWHCVLRKNITPWNPLLQKNAQTSNIFKLFRPKCKSLSDKWVPTNSITWPIDLQRNSHLAGALNVMGGVCFCPLKITEIELLSNKQARGFFFFPLRNAFGDIKEQEA